MTAGADRLAADTRPARVRTSLRAALPRSGPWNRDAALLAVVVVALVLLGLLMSFSASFVDAAEGGDPFGTFRRQLVWAVAGLLLFVVAAATDHRVWRLLAWPMLAASLAGLLAVLLPGLGLSEHGSTRWIAVGRLVVQPSEVAKLATLLWLADVHTRKRERGIATERRTAHLLVPALPLLAVEGLLILLQPDLGTTLIVALTVGLVLWADGIPLRLVAVLGSGGLLATAAAAVVEDYRLARITGWLAPEADPLGSGFQLLQSLYALGSGGLFGVGLGSSRGKWNFVPNPETDFIFAIIGEELGLVGALVVLLLFAALLVAGAAVARRAEDTFGRIVAVGATGVIVGQALVNVAAVTGLVPITGVTLPFVSVGGSSLVTTLVAAGVVVSVARRHGEPPRRWPRPPLRAVRGGGAR